MYRFLKAQTVDGADYAAGQVADLSGLRPRTLRRMLDNRRIVPVASAAESAPASGGRRR